MCEAWLPVCVLLRDCAVLPSRVTLQLCQAACEGASAVVLCVSACVCVYVKSPDAFQLDSKGNTLSVYYTFIFASSLIRFFSLSSIIKNYKYL